MGKFYISMAVFLLCSGCESDRMISIDHHPAPKYDKFLEQCDDWDQYICNRRYEDLAIQ